MISEDSSALLYAENAQLRQRIAELERQSEEQRDYLQWLQRIVDHTPFLLSVHDLAEQRVIYANHDLSGLLGYALPEIQQMGRMYRETMVHPDDRPRIEACLSALAAAQDAGGQEMEYRVQHRDGQWRWLSSYAVVIERAADGTARHMLMITHDMTEHKQREEDLARQRSELAQQVEARMMELLETNRVLLEEMNERVNVEEQLRAVQAKLMALFAATTDVVLVVDRQGRYCDIAPNSSPLLYKPAAELLGKTLHDVFPAAQADSFLQTVQQSLQHCQPMHITYMLPINEQERWFSATVAPLSDDAVICVARDITVQRETEEQMERWVQERTKLLEETTARLREELDNRRRAEQALEESEARLNAFFTAAPAGLLLFDEHLRYRRVNETAAQINGVAIEEHIGKTIPEVLPELAPVALPIYERVLRTGQPLLNGEISGETPSQPGVLRYWQVSIFPIFSVGRKPSGVGAIFVEITERRRTENDLRASEERYRLLSENSRDLICLHEPDGRYLYVSPAVYDLLGYAPEELIGMMPYELFHPADRERIRAESHERALAGRLDNAIEYRIRRKDGRYIWLSTYTRPIFDGQRVVRLQTSSRDITRQKQIEAELQEREQMLRTIIDASPDIISRTGLDGSVLWISPSSEEILGYPVEEREAEGSIDRIHPDDRQKTIETFQQFVSGETTVQRHRYRVRHADGHWVHLDVNSRLRLNADGQPDSIVSISRDVSRQVELEEALQRAYDELERRVLERTAELQETNTLLLREVEERKRVEAALQEHKASFARQIEERTADLRLANAQLSNAARLKDEFLANMSHELRTPLNAILGLSEALREEIYGTLTPKQHHSLDTITESGRHLLAMINDILDLSKIESGKTQLELTDIPVDQLCQSSLRLVKTAAYKKNLTISESLDSSITSLRLDERRVRQILVNLLSNAVKFTPAGGQIGLAVHGDQEAGIVRFVVWDTGVGIAQADMSRLFKPFVQIDSSLSRKYEGSGLGLALVARLAELHGGSVAVESEVDKGSRFTVSLPWQVGERPYTAIYAEQEAGVSPIIPAELQRALIIEDSPTAAEQVTRYLNEMGIAVVTLSRGSTAVEQSIAVGPDIIILDILLPDVSGWEVLQSLKADQRTRDIPVLVISVVDDRSRALTLGAGAALVKPISREQLHGALQVMFAPEPPVVQRALVMVAEPASREHRPLILLAEDNEDSIGMLTDYLHSRGYQCVIARNGAEAIERVREARPLLILMDIQMPGMDGLEATRRIRSDAELAVIPIIAMTALAMPGDRERCLEAGASDYISKPVSLKQLVQTIEAHL